MKVFFDANIYYSGVRSHSGASWILMKLVRYGLLELYLSDHVLQTARFRVLNQETPQAYRRLTQFLQESNYRLVTTDIASAMTTFSAIIHDPEDVAVLAAADAAKVDYLVTLDRRHFFTTKVRKSTAVRIVLPGELVEIIRDKLKQV